MSASCRLLCVAAPVYLGRSSWIGADGSHQVRTCRTYAVGLIALITSKYASQHAQSPRDRSVTGVRVASQPPCLLKNPDCYNYR
jgi:hypothetical protein